MSKKLTSKKNLIILISVVLVLTGGLFFWLRSRRQGEPEVQEGDRQQNRITEPVNVIPVSQRPYMLISPRANGRYIDIIVKSLVKPAQEMEYELEYQSGSLLQGSFGSVEIDDLPVEHEILLGSCSAGGSCTYHEDIKGGTLLMRFSGEENYVLKSDWRYIDNSTGEASIGSRDAKFQLESEDLAAVRYLIVFNSPGAPEGLEAELKSDIYAVAGSSNTEGTGDLTIRANEEAENLTIYGYNGQEWQEFETEVEGKMARAEVELVEAYAAAAAQ